MWNSLLLTFSREYSFFYVSSRIMFYFIYILQKYRDLHSGSISRTCVKWTIHQRNVRCQDRSRTSKHLCTSKVDEWIKIYGSQRDPIANIHTLRRPAVKVECVGGNGRASYLKDREAKWRLKGDGDENRTRLSRAVHVCTGLSTHAWISMLESSRSRRVNRLSDDVGPRREGGVPDRAIYKNELSRSFRHRAFFSRTSSGSIVPWWRSCCSPYAASSLSRPVESSRQHPRRLERRLTIRGRPATWTCR